MYKKKKTAAVSLILLVWRIAFLSYKMCFYTASLSGLKKNKNKNFKHCCFTLLLPGPDLMRYCISDTVHKGTNLFKH